MNISDELNIRIENYVNGLMSDLERSAFEKDMAADESLKKAVELEQRLQRGFELKGEQELKERITNIAQEVMSESKVVPFYRKWSISMAIAASVSLIAVTYFVLRPSESSEMIQDDWIAMVDQELASGGHYITTYLENGSLRGGSDDSEQARALKEVYEVMSTGDNLAAKRKVTTYLEKYPNEPNGIYARAQIFMSEGRWGYAIEQLALLKDIDNRSLRNEALYYSALCHFKIEEGKEIGTKILTQITKDSRSEYQITAKQMLEIFD